jgi:hypothetical protein
VIENHRATSWAEFFADKADAQHSYATTSPGRERGWTFCEVRDPSRSIGAHSGYPLKRVRRVEGRAFGAPFARRPARWSDLARYGSESTYSHVPREPVPGAPRTRPRRALAGQRDASLPRLAAVAVMASATARVSRKDPTMNPRIHSSRAWGANARAPRDYWS